MGGLWTGAHAPRRPHAPHGSCQRVDLTVRIREILSNCEKARRRSRVGRVARGYLCGGLLRSGVTARSLG